MKLQAIAGVTKCADLSCTIKSGVNFLKFRVYDVSRASGTALLTEMQTRVHHISDQARSILQAPSSKLFVKIGTRADATYLLMDDSEARSIVESVQNQRIDLAGVYAKNEVIVLSPDHYQGALTPVSHPMQLGLVPPLQQHQMMRSYSPEEIQWLLQAQRMMQLMQQQSQWGLFNQSPGSLMLGPPSPMQNPHSYKWYVGGIVAIAAISATGIVVKYGLDKVTEVVRHYIDSQAQTTLELAKLQTHEGVELSKQRYKAFREVVAGTASVISAWFGIK